MIRLFLLGGRWGPVPAPLFLALGASACGAAGIVLLETFATPWFVPLGAAVGLALLLAGVVLFAFGAHRRRGGPGRPPPPSG